MSATSTPDGRAAGWRVIALLAVALLLAILFALIFGTESTSFLRALSEPDSLDHLIVVKARLPRVLLAAIAGAGLSVVGASLQALLRDPLAAPLLLRVSGGAAVGATRAI